MRKRAREEITPVTAMYNEQLITLNAHPKRKSISPKLPSFMSLKSSLYCNQRSRLPPMLKMRDEIRVEGDWTKTLTGKNFLLRDDGDSNKILILGHKRTYWSFLSSIPSMWMIPSPPVLPYFTSSSQSMALLTVSNSLWYMDSSLLKLEQITTDSSLSWRKRYRTVAWPCNLLLWWQTLNLH